MDLPDNPTWKEELAALQRFRRALRKSDQETLDELLKLAQDHLPQEAVEDLLPLTTHILSCFLALADALQQADLMPQGRLIGSPSTGWTFATPSDLKKLRDAGLSVDSEDPTYCELEE
jgi:hypothetical protein